MTFKKGNYVRHPNDKTHEKWGVGVVVSEDNSTAVSAFYENELRTITSLNSYVTLLKVENPGDSALLLDNALYEEKGDRIPFPQVLDRFLKRFKGGLSGPVYMKEERDYKLAAHELALELLNKTRMKSLIETEKWEALATDIKKVFSKAKLLASFEMIKLSDAFKTIEGAEHLSRAFYELLYGEGSMYQRIESARLKFERYELDKWPVVTYLPFIIFPKKYMFIKPTMTREAAANRGFDIQYSSQVNGSTYERVQLFSRELLDRLNRDGRSELHPIDMIDVQGFMWCTFAKGWKDEEIEKAERELSA